ncbi:homeobox-leucine zipper protein glabra 2 [Phtheirospermum japonicum]|uniref:Homeobox-leucine zipper protein glabra 2 n=1 Tax=Phtheirospermum japonicum TaxID=374723 RepID=A0A830BIH7_9LAMI|nr:homeobox-leucine zipper protein glabra 2 [Phtheirospermum japonicum]
MLRSFKAGIFRDGGATAAEGGGGEGRREETVEISSENSGAAGKSRLFKESPHPDEKQRLQLSKQLGLHPRQVKFWFQNRRTQIKAIQERHENSLLKTEIDKLRDENKGLRDNIKQPSCPNCGFASPSKDAITGTEEQKLRIENARLKAEKHPGGTSPNSSSYASANDEENRSSLDFYTGNFGIEKSRIMDAANRAMDELRKMATNGEPLWIRSYETGREILNYDEYMKEFCAEENCNMFAEIQMLTPMVATREVYFVRHCKQLSANQWAIVDVSVDRVEDNLDASLQKCRKRPSGCIIEDTSNGHCKVVTWVEHVECQKITVHSMYRTIVSSGLGFGAKRWVSTLQQQCERLVFLVATNVPTKDSSGNNLKLFQHTIV